MLWFRGTTCLWHEGYRGWACCDGSDQARGVVLVQGHFSSRHGMMDSHQRYFIWRAWRNSLVLTRHGPKYLYVERHGKIDPALKRPLEFSPPPCIT